MRPIIIIAVIFICAAAGVWAGQRANAQSVKNHEAAQDAAYAACTAQAKADTADIPAGLEHFQAWWPRLKACDALLEEHNGL